MGYSLLGVHANSAVGGLPETLKQWKPPLIVVLDHSDVWHDVKAASPNTVFVGRVYQEFEPDFNDPGLNPLAGGPRTLRRDPALGRAHGRDLHLLAGCQRADHPLRRGHAALRRL